MKTSKDERQRIADEMIELGEMLFDMAIDVAAPQPKQDEASDAAFIEEIRAAANEFFTALRLLLATDQDPSEPNR